MSAKYTEKEVEKIKCLYKEGTPLVEIAKVINRSVDSIRNKAYSLGITKPNNYTEYEKQYIRDNYASYNLKEIANHLNRPKTNIVRWVKQQGIERTGRKKENPIIKTPKNPEETKILKSNIMKEWHATHEHPRGMLGKTHTEKVRNNIAEGAKRYFKNATEEDLNNRKLKSRNTRIKNQTLYVHKNKPTGYSRGNKGEREGMEGIYFKSSWEANMAKYFEYKGYDWEYEPKRFIFKTDERPISYCPDFLVNGKWYEIKGWKDKKSKLSLAKFKSQYPEEYAKLILIEEKQYLRIEKKYASKIKDWEFKK